MTSNPASRISIPSKCNFTQKKQENAHDFPKNWVYFGINHVDKWWSCPDPRQPLKYRPTEENISEEYNDILYFQLLQSEQTLKVIMKSWLIRITYDRSLKNIFHYQVSQSVILSVSASTSYKHNSSDGDKNWDWMFINIQEILQTCGLQINDWFVSSFNNLKIQTEIGVLKLNTELSWM